MIFPKYWKDEKNVKFKQILLRDRLGNKFKVIFCKFFMQNNKVLAKSNLNWKMQLKRTRIILQDSLLSNRRSLSDVKVSGTKVSGSLIWDCLKSIIVKEGSVENLFLYPN